MLADTTFTVPDLIPARACSSSSRLPFRHEPVLQTSPTMRDLILTFILDNNLQLWGFYCFSTIDSKTHRSSNLLHHLTPSVPRLSSDNLFARVLTIRRETFQHQRLRTQTIPTLLSRGPSNLRWFDRFHNRFGFCVQFL